MNREIKFRAWNDGKMLYSHNNIENDSNFQNAWFFHLIREDAIVMQYTGLKDINGKKIFAGDILSDKWKAIVSRNDEGTYIVTTNYGTVYSLKKWLIMRQKAGAPEDNIIIGNIYENPELMEGNNG